MWRAIFFLLVLANLILFAWGQGHFGGQDEGREPARLSGQSQPEKLRVAGQMIGEPAPVEVAPSLQTPEGAAQPLGFLVHIPPLPGKAAADKKAAELGQLGIKDFQVVMEEGPAQFSISLGMFGSEQAANGFLAGLAARGVKSARVQVIGAAAP
ncbi:MAG: SPOR domain-containing protein [Rhodocyclaceae bacterium]|nr:SPOR domain-containing protein [Rhodocyclaceae bacterium]